MNKTILLTWMFCFGTIPWWPRMVQGQATTRGPVSGIARPDCLDTCGNVSVPYPFGIGARCAYASFFNLTCNSSANPPTLLFGNIPVRNISVDEGTMILSMLTAYDCYNNSGFERRGSVSIRLGSGPFRFSDTRNKLTGIGCDTMAFMRDARGNFGSGCVSLCNQAVNFSADSTCSGIGCCQTTSIPPNLKTLNITIGSTANHSSVLTFNPCGVAFLADERTFRLADYRLSDRPPVGQRQRKDAVIEWVAEEKECNVAMGNATSYACNSMNTQCIYSENGQGYRCLCQEGFAGNPYLGGCEDINECLEPETYPCEGKCRNTVGNYTCHCPLGMRGDGKVGCRGFRLTTMVTVIGAVILVIVISILIFVIYKRRRKEKNFLENGGMLLKHQRVRIFTEKELAKATKNYDSSQFLGEGGFGSVYRGVLADNTVVAVKRPKDSDKIKINHEFQHEIGTVSQVNHKNVVKILGLCLETKVPLLVYEFISSGTLFQHINDKSSPILKTWTNRLRIAAETALALDYLHSLANPPIIHGDVKSLNILLDDSFTAKVSDFGASVFISPGQTDIATRIQGTFGYLDPEYLMTGILTAKSDVYSFGVVLVELLTGEKPNSGTGEKSNLIQYFISALESNKLFQVLCFKVTEEAEMEEVEVFAQLARQCLYPSGMKRPSMKQVAEELNGLMKLHESSWSQGNSEETEHLLGQSASYNPATMNQLPDIVSLTTFEAGYSVDSV